MTTSATSDENPRSRPPSTTVGRTTEESDTARRKKQDQGDIADKPRSASALDRRLEKEPHVQKQKSQSQVQNGSDLTLLSHRAKKILLH